MAYNIGDRFPRLPKAYRILDPGAYNIVESILNKPNNVPFLSTTARNTQSRNPIWTHALYYADQPPKIPNCASIKSKCPRFPYEAFSKEDLEAILCKCGIENVCECTSEDEEEPKVICQAKVHRRLYIGHPPRSAIAGGLSAPSKNDHGFNIMPDGTIKRKFWIKKEQSPPFYDAEVIETTAFYRGCKWSKWKATRAAKSLEDRPGPADYNIERQPTKEEICAENVRHEKRKTSKLLRFIEEIQQKELLEGRPGPATYSPKNPRGSDFEYTGSKADRFPESLIEQRPGPADHWIRRDFDLPEGVYSCHAKLPEPSFFGVKALRFKPRKEEGPSPATYDPTINKCKIMHCTTAAFGSSSVRFKDIPVDEDYELKAETDQDEDKENHETCPKPTWEFKSKTIRIDPLTKKMFEQSPADLPMSNIHVERPDKSQYIAPFYSSEGRFQPWYDWMPVFGRLNTPGPAYYNFDKPKCLPAVGRGPLVRSKRFPTKRYGTPAPNYYKIGGGVETILATHNERLKSNIINQHKYHWEPPIEPKQLSIEERNSLLLNKCIALCEPDGKIPVSVPSFHKDSDKFQDRPKLLRCFLYSNPIQPYF